MISIRKMINKRLKFKYHEDYFKRYDYQEETIKYGKDSPIKAFYNLDKDYLTKANTEILDKDEWVDYVINGGSDEFLITSACGARILLNNGFFIKGIYELGNFFRPLFSSEIFKKLEELSKLKLKKHEKAERFWELLGAFKARKTYYESNMGWYLIQLCKNEPKVLDIGIYKAFDDFTIYDDFVDFANELKNTLQNRIMLIRNKGDFDDKTIAEIEKDIKMSEKLRKGLWHKVLTKTLPTTLEMYFKAVEAFINRRWVNYAKNYNTR